MSAVAYAHHRKAPSAPIVPRSRVSVPTKRDFMWLGNIIPKADRLEGLPGCTKETRVLVFEVLSKHEMTWAMVTGCCRAIPELEARRELCHRLHYEKGWSQSKIGRFINRDRTSVMNLLRRKARYDKKDNAEQF